MYVVGLKLYCIFKCDLGFVDHVLKIETFFFFFYSRLLLILA